MVGQGSSRPELDGNKLRRLFPDMAAVRHTLPSPASQQVQRAQTAAPRGPPAGIPPFRPSSSSSARRTIAVQPSLHRDGWNQDNHRCHRPPSAPTVSRHPPWRCGASPTPQHHITSPKGRLFADSFSNANAADREYRARFLHTLDSVKTATDQRVLRHTPRPSPGNTFGSMLTH